MVRASGVVAALSLLIAAPASAGEIFLGGFAHDTSLGVSGSAHEGGTYDYEIGVRTHQFTSLWYLLQPMFYAKGQFNTDARTNFYTGGVEWRKHLFHSAFYGDFNVGGSYVDGFADYPDKFNPNVPLPANATPAQAARYDYDKHIYEKFKAEGSQAVFNPGFTLGYDLPLNFAAELSWEHYSNAGLGDRNPGLDTFGARIVYRFGGPF